LPDDLRGVGKAAGAMPGINQSAVNRNVEHSGRAFDEFGLGADCALDVSCQTGSLRQIVSGGAVGDRNLHSLLQLDCGRSAPLEEGSRFQFTAIFSPQRFQ